MTLNVLRSSRPKLIGLMLFPFGIAKNSKTHLMFQFSDFAIIGPLQLDSFFKSYSLAIFNDYFSKFTIRWEGYIPLIKGIKFELPE